MLKKFTVYKGVRALIGLDRVGADRSVSFMIESEFKSRKIEKSVAGVADQLYSSSDIVFITALSIKTFWSLVTRRCSKNN